MIQDVPEPPPYSAVGKQVLQNGQHFADAVSEVAAGAIAASMNMTVNHKATCFHQWTHTALRGVMYCGKCDSYRNNPLI